MKILYMLVGLPGVGKSYWVEHQTTLDNFDVISSDRHIEEYAKAVNKTYSDVFDDYVKTASKLMELDLQQSIINQRNIIWDQTNLTPKSRSRKLLNFPDYYKVAVVFKTPPEDVHDQQLKRPGKVISKRLLFQMNDSFQLPTLDEGFDEIRYSW